MNHRSCAPIRAGAFVTMVVATIALLAGTGAASALPAAASSNTAANEAFSVGATGPVSVQLVGAAVYPGGPAATLPNADMAGLLHTGVARNTAGPASATAALASPAVTLPDGASLRAARVVSSCHFNAGTSTVSTAASIAGGRVALPGGRVIRLPAHPGPDTLIRVAGVAKIVLGRQIRWTGGALIVDAIFMSIHRTHQTMSLGASLCYPATLAPAPMAPGATSAITLGGLGVIALAGIGYVARTRRSAPASALPTGYAPAARQPPDLQGPEGH